MTRVLCYYSGFTRLAEGGIKRWRDSIMIDVRRSDDIERSFVEAVRVRAVRRENYPGTVYPDPQSFQLVSYMPQHGRAVFDETRDGGSRCEMESPSLH